MKENRFLFLSIIIIVLLVFGTYGIYSHKNKNLEDTSLKLKYHDQAQFAGNYLAKEKGFYKREGLNVEIIPYENKKSINSVLSKEADFGIAGAYEILEARDEGHKIKALAVIYRRSPIGIYSLQEANITKPTDLIGKRVGIQEGEDIKISYSFLLNKLNINKSKIIEIPVGKDNKELINGTVDAIIGFTNNAPYNLIAQNKEVNIILITDYEANSYGDVIFSTEEFIKNNPEKVNRFLIATIDGWAYALNNQNEAIKKTLKYSSKMNRTEEEEKYLLSSSTLLIAGKMVKIGQMENRDWEIIKEKLVYVNKINNSINVEEAYTNEFIDKIYN